MNKIAKKQDTEELQEVDKELGKENEKEEDFSLMPEGQEMIRKIDFESVIFRQIDRTSRRGTEGELGFFGNAVSVLDAQLEFYKDDKFRENEKEIDERYNQLFEKIEEEQPDDPKPGQISQLIAHYQTEKNLERFKLLINLLGKLRKI